MVKAGAFILVLVYQQAGLGGVGLAMHEFPNLESCKAAAVKMENEKSYIDGYCVAKDVTK
jgi:hypothetical protein